MKTSILKRCAFLGAALFLLAFFTPLQARKYIPGSSNEWAGPQYRRAIKDTGPGFHQITLPPQIYAKSAPGFRDLRIRKEGDEKPRNGADVPYILRTHKEKSSVAKISFQLINQSQSQQKRFYTFALRSPATINTIDLNFNKGEFDLYVNVEGSQDLANWELLKKNLRIVSIARPYMNYRHTTLHFPEARYRYFRISFADAKNPLFTGAKLTYTKTIPAKRHRFDNIDFSVTEQQHGNGNRTIIDIDLKEPLPLSQMQIDASSSFDYYRNIKILYLPLRTVNKENYILLHSNILTSLKKNSFSFSPAPARHWRMIIENYDDQPLKIQGVKTSIEQTELIARFDKNRSPDDSFYLYYGDPAAAAPRYDLARFQHKIPSTAKTATLGKEEQLYGPEEEPEPLFVSQLWLWVITGVLIIGLGSATILMISKASQGKQKH